MRTRLKLKPGQRGTKKLLKRYGSQLICVRYRYDVVQKKRFKTVELIVDEVHWEPQPKPLSVQLQEEVYIRLEASDDALRERIKQAHGRWNLNRKLWALPYGTAIELGLTDKIVS